jgi:hypothetical protein
MNDLHEEIERLSRMSLTELRVAWRERCKTPPPPYQSRVLLLHAFAYRLQAATRASSAGRPSGAWRALQSSLKPIHAMCRRRLNTSS